MSLRVGSIFFFTFRSLVDFACYPAFLACFRPVSEP
jgi:hypothetical protein